MKFPKLKVLVETGGVREVIATYEATEAGWVVQVTYTTRTGERTEPLERQRGGVRVFATLDAVAAGLAACGCESFRVINPRSSEGSSDDR